MSHSLFGFQRVPNLKTIIPLLYVTILHILLLSLYPLFVVLNGDRCNLQVISLLDVPISTLCFINTCVIIKQDAKHMRLYIYISMPFCFEFSRQVQAIKSGCLMHKMYF